MTSSKVEGFDWDVANRGKCRKHGLEIAELEAVFAHPHRLAPDIGHSNEEARYLAIGNGGGSRPIFVVFTLRTMGNKTLIRPISARYMHQKEIRYYEKAFANPDQ
jgi:uncharacterized protein